MTICIFVDSRQAQLTAKSLKQNSKRLAKPMLSKLKPKEMYTYTGIPPMRDIHPLLFFA